MNLRFTIYEKEPEIDLTDTLLARHYRIAEGAACCQNCEHGHRPADGPLFWCRDTDSAVSPSHVCDEHPALKGAKA